MLAKKECYKCLKNLSLLALDLSISENKTLKSKRKHLKASLLKLLESKFSTQKVPAAIFTLINRRIKKLTKVQDAFIHLKKTEVDISRKISKKIRKKYKNNLEDLLLFSVAGNSIDFFKEINKTAKEMQKHICFKKNNLKAFKNKLSYARTILFFADNSGEMYFDLPLVKFLSKKARTYYIVKSNPVQNDLTIKILNQSALKNKFPLVHSSGNDAVGIELKTLHKNLALMLKKCDLIIAKGMGYYETFSELKNFKEKTFYLLMAKCKPVANSLNANLNDYLFIKI